LELRLHFIDSLCSLDLRFACQHSTHDPTDLVSQDRQVFAKLATVDVVQFGGNRGVHTAQPLGEPLKQTLHLNARSLTFKQVDLKVVGKLLLVLALLLKRHGVPSGNVLDTKRVKENLHISGNPRRRTWATCNVGVNAEEEVRRFMQEG